MRLCPAHPIPALHLLAQALSKGQGPLSGLRPFVYGASNQGRTKSTYGAWLGSNLQGAPARLTREALRTTYYPPVVPRRAFGLPDSPVL
jgi:hypothetical protein